MDKVKNMRKIYIIFVLVLFCTMSFSKTVSAKDLSFSSSDDSAVLEGGYYENVTIDGSKIYEKGYNDGKNRSTFTETFDTIIVDPSEWGMFTKDGSSDAKTFTNASTTGVDLGVSAKSEYEDALRFEGWDINVSNKILTLTAKFRAPEEFNYTGSVQKWVCQESGTYKLTVYGAGNGSDGGGMMQGSLHVDKGTILYVYVGGTCNGTTGGWNGGGNGAGGDGATGGGGATDIRMNGTSLSDRIIVGGGAGGKCAFTRDAQYGGYPSGGASRHWTGSEPYTTDGVNHGGSVVANPGTQTSGYALGQGQNSYTRSGGSYGVGWGGGGGGYYGGYCTTSSGQSSDCGGGGGSSYYKSGTVTYISHVNGAQTSNGKAQIVKIG